MRRRHLAAMMVIVLVLGVGALWLGSNPVTAEQGEGAPDATPAAGQAAGQDVFFPAIIGPAATGTVTPAPTATSKATGAPTATFTSTATSTATATPTATATNEPIAYTIAGFVQKGPFIQGTEITVRELDNNFVPTGRTFTGRIDDNTGHFSVRGMLAYPYVEISANGFYFNEVSGSLSAAPISLLALADLRDSTTVNVNLLTHLESARVFALIDGGLAYSAAKTQAQHEVLAMFNLADADIGRSETLDIAQVGEGNAILLAISAILQSNRSEAQLTELLSTLSSDLGMDGVLNSATARQALVDGMEYMKPRRAAIRSNIVSRYAALGVPASVPPFEAYAFALDVVAPVVVFTSPSDGADLEVGSITIVFSELMTHGTLTSSTVQLSDGNGEAVAGSLGVTDAESATSVVFTPQSRLVPDTYQLAIGTEVQDLAGNGLAAVGVGFTHTPISELAVGNSGTTLLGSVTTLTATVPGNSSNVSFGWNFGDGATGSGAVTTHIYVAVGNHLAVVTATNGVSQAVTGTVVNVIDRAIIGLQVANSGTTRLGNSTMLTATILDGSNVAYLWDFGDGTAGSGPSVSHIYAAVGSYTATVTATNGVSQAVTGTVVNVIDRMISGLQVANSGPTQLGSATLFTATLLDGSNVVYVWSFGDGATGGGVNAVHTYVARGEYTATVTATNELGSESGATVAIVEGDEIYIPAGTFEMGCDSNNSVETYCYASEQPYHAVYLDAYYIDEFEVTNASYKACVDAGQCMAPNERMSVTRPWYYGNAIFNDYPVIYVDWYQATAFCAWEGKRLPTEAEWEKAARGASETRKYPWGNSAPDCAVLNFSSESSGVCVGDTSPVGSYLSGASVYGVKDMAGNVWEWVNDWYDNGYYSVSPASNPQGPGTGAERILRGGEWGSPSEHVRSAIRGTGPPDLAVASYGFRCARTP